jgi:hypothetical protein
MTYKSAHSGFVIISFTLFASVLGLFFLLYLGHFQSIQAARKTRNECRGQLIDALETMLTGVHKAIHLNTPLKGLNLSIKLAHSMLAINPQNPLAWKLLIESEKNRTKVIHLQNGILTATETRWKFKLSKLFTQKRFNEKSIYHIQQKFHQIEVSDWSIPVRREDPNDPYSPLILTEDIADRTQITQYWAQTSQLQLGEKTWKNKFTTHLGCQASIIRISPEKGEIKLTEDKLLSKVRFFF